MTISKDLAQIKEIQRKAHQGETGERRREFVRAYREVMESACAEVKTEALRYTDSTGEVISCGKGCNHCCEHFISIPVSHGVVIADYLYSSENAMNVFLHNYDRWLEATREPEAAAIFAKLEDDTLHSAAVKTSPQELLSSYHTIGNPCPFLKKKGCSIYAVRPLVCAAYFAVSPPEFCMKESDIPAALIQVTPSQAKLRKLAELDDPRFSLHQECLPTLVYKLLTKGVQDVALEVSGLFAAQEAPPQPGTEP